MKTGASHTTVWRLRVLGGVLVMAACLTPVSVSAQASLEYQNRGDRYEGVRPRPVSGYDIELISALIDYQDSAAKLPDQLKVRFFLEQESEAHLTIRKLDVKHYYWLDRARSSRPWAHGFDTREQGPYAFASPSLIAQYALESWGVRFGVRLRSTPLVLHESELLRIIKAKGFNHPARQTQSRYGPPPVQMEGVFGHFRHEYEPRTLNGARVVIDHATGLMWQQSSSELLREVKPVSFIGDLNRSRHAGFTDWRLPTIEELASLIEARATSGQGGRERFIDPVFDLYVTCVSADRVLIRDEHRSLRVAFWYGGLAMYAMEDSVCAVRSLGPDEIRSTASPGAK